MRYDWIFTWGLVFGIWVRRTSLWVINWGCVELEGMVLI